MLERGPATAESEEEFYIEPPRKGEPIFVGSSIGTPGLAGPWTRYFARVFDLSFLGTILMTAITLILPYISLAMSLQWYMADSRVAFLVLLPVIMLINAVIISLLGNSIGRAIFGIKPVPLDGRTKFSFRENVRRELTVWVQGLALGIPVLNFFTMIPAFGRVSKGLPTTYDLGIASVRSFSDNKIRRAFGMLLVIALLVGITTLNAVERVDQGQLQSSTRWTNPETGLSATIPAGWQHEVVQGPDGSRLDGFTNVNTGMVGLLGKETASNLDLAEYAEVLKAALVGNTPLGQWSSAGVSRNILKASGVSIGDKWPTTIYVTQAGTSYWRIVFIDLVNLTPRELVEPELTTALFGTIQ